MEVVKITPELQKNLNIITAFKAEVDKIGENCKQIKVVDDSTLAIGQQNLSKANQLATTIEEKRKQIKQPYLDAGTLIDSEVKRIVGGLKDGIAHIKAEVGAWEKKRQEEERLKQEEVARKLKEEQDKIAAEAKRKQDILDYINLKAHPALESIYTKCVSVEVCDTKLAEIEKNYKPREFFAEFADDAYALRDRYVGLIKAKREQLAQAGTLSDAEKELAAKNEALERKRLETERMQRELDAEKERFRLEKEKVEMEAAAETERQRLEDLAQANKTKGIRYNWGFELVDIKQVPLEWLTIDESKVKEYIKAQKEHLKDGEVMNGVKFIKKQSVVA